MKLPPFEKAEQERARKTLSAITGTDDIGAAFKRRATLLDVKEIQRRSLVFAEAVSEAIPVPEKSQPSRVRATYCCLQLAMEYFRTSLRLLDKPEDQAAAFALQRVIHEAIVRSMWLCLVATDDQVRRAVDHDNFPDLSRMGPAVVKAISRGERISLFAPAGDFKGRLNSLAHSGKEQFKSMVGDPRRFADRFSQGDKLEAMIRPCTMIGVSAQIFCFAIESWNALFAITDVFLSKFPLMTD